MFFVPLSGSAAVCLTCRTVMRLCWLFCKRRLESERFSHSNIDHWTLVCWSLLLYWCEHILLLSLTKLNMMSWFATHWFLSYYEFVHVLLHKLLPCQYSKCIFQRPCCWGSFLGQTLIPPPASGDLWQLKPGDVWALSIIHQRLLRFCTIVLLKMLFFLPRELWFTCRHIRFILPNKSLQSLLIGKYLIFLFHRSIHK